jgi:hypothetical protein
MSGVHHSMHFLDIHMGKAGQCLANLEDIHWKSRVAGGRRHCIRSTATASHVNPPFLSLHQPLVSDMVLHLHCRLVLRMDMWVVLSCLGTFCIHGWMGFVGL